MSLPEINELSERERDILRLVATGAGNKQIAAQLFISTNTVKVHLRNIFAKIGVTSRTEAAMVAIRLGLAESSVVQAVNGMSAAGRSEAQEEADIPAASGPAAGENPQVESSSQAVSIPDEQPGGKLPARRLTRLQAWGLGIAGLALVVLLVMALGWPGLRPLISPAKSPGATSSPAPRITALPRWRARSSMPAARMNLAVVAYEDAIYAIGGQAVDGVSGAVERYDPSANTWQALRAKPLAVEDIQAVVIGGMIYVPGGRTASGALTNALEIYDPGVDQWERGADLPAPVSAYAIAAFEGRLYLFGGWDGARFTNAAYEYDPRLDRWASLTPMPTRRGYAGAAVAGGKIYVIGGKDEQTVLAVVEVYSPDREGRENPWREATPMPGGRFGMAITNVADIIYVVSGQGSDDTPQPSLAHIQQTDTWQTFEQPPENRSSGAGLAALGEYLYIVGGKAGAAPLADMLAYQVVYTVGIPVIIK